MRHSVLTPGAVPFVTAASPPRPVDRATIAPAWTEPLIPDAPLVTVEVVESRIMRLRGHKVILDVDLAELYSVETRALLQAVRRNPDRFPSDFMFQLTWQEGEEVALRKAGSGPDASRSQSVTLKRGQNPKYRPIAFTEQGVAMLSSVLRSPRALLVNVEIMRAFVRMRQMIGVVSDLAQRMDDMEEQYDERFRVVFEAIRELMEPAPDADRPRVGFRTEPQK